MHIPRFIVDIETGGFDVLVCLDNHGSQSTSLVGLHLRVPQLGFNAHSEFTQRSWSRRDHAGEPSTGPTHLVDAPYLLQFAITGFIGPANLQSIFEDRVSMDRPSRHILAHISQIELQAHGDVLATMPAGAQMASIDKRSIIVRLRGVSDTFVADLTDSNALSVIPDLLSARPPSPTEPPPLGATHTKSLLEVLPAGVSADLAIATISCLASGLDLAPGNTKPIKRGVELRVGLAASYSSMHDRRHSHRTRGERFTSTQHRDRLQLRENILCEAVSVSQELNEGLGEKGAVIRLEAFNFQVRPMVDCGNAFAPLCDWETKPFQSIPTALLSVPQIRIDMLLKRTIAPQSTEFQDICRVVADVRCVRLNLSVHHGYCLALASTALSQIKPPSTPSSPRPSSRDAIALHVVGHLGNLQARVNLPGTQNVYISLEKAKVALRDFQCEVSFGIMHAWALSTDGKWDEVLRMRQFEILAPLDRSNLITINGQGARLRIPYEFSFASLIQEISLAFKATKHIFHIVQAGHFIAMGTPEAEDAKRVPPLSISVNALVIEAVDDPFETKLSLLWRAGLKEQQERLVRQEAFDAKVEAIRVEETGDPGVASPNSAPSHEWSFGSKHTVSIEEAQERLKQFNSSAWISAYNTAMMAIAKREGSQLRRVGQIPGALNLETSVPLDIRNIETVPPLIRLLFDGVRFDLAQPSFTNVGSSLPEFLKRTGGLPLDTQYTLLVPINIRWEMRYAMVTLRDYPLPLLHVRANPDQSPSWTTCIDLVIAEEIGPSDSVEWISTTIVPRGVGTNEQAGFSLLVPKTGMPVKTYANPEVHVTSPYATDISWGVSYQPCVADVMRVIDSLSHPSRDPSSPLGFWDKLRLSLHGKLRISFTAGLNLLIKGLPMLRLYYRYLHNEHYPHSGSRDPYEILGNGAGFALCWTGHPEIFVGHHFDEKELIQFRGDRMVVGIPK